MNYRIISCLNGIVQHKSVEISSIFDKHINYKIMFVEHFLEY